MDQAIGLGFLQGGGALGALIRGNNWSAAAIGAAEEWSQSLRTVVKNRRMFLNRLPGGRLEETFFAFSHSPIRDQSGGIGGLFHPKQLTLARQAASHPKPGLQPGEGL